MPKTMVANISGARLREAEKQLAELRGADAVNAFLEAHPNETKVLQQLVDWRRAGKPAPSLARVQRAMLWSDGTIEFNTVTAPEPPARPERFGRAPGGRPGQSGPGRGPGRPGAAPAYGRGPGGAGPRPSAGPGGGPGGAGPRPSAGPGRGPGRPGAAPAYGRGPGGPRPSTGYGPGRPPGPPGQRRDGRGGRYGDREDTSHLPREGEGWALVRPGDLERAQAAEEAAALAAEAEAAAASEDEAAAEDGPLAARVAEARTEAPADAPAADGSGA
jgi:hypothetical protein